MEAGNGGVGEILFVAGIGDGDGDREEYRGHGRGVGGYSLSPPCPIVIPKSELRLKTNFTYKFKGSNPELDIFGRALSNHYTSTQGVV